VAVELAKASAEPAWQISGFFMPVGNPYGKTIFSVRTPWHFFLSESYCRNACSLVFVSWYCCEVYPVSSTRSYRHPGLASDILCENVHVVESESLPDELVSILYKLPAPAIRHAHFVVCKP
jgi:hypothetical protein